MARIGIVSDTHGTLPSGAYRALSGCDTIIHAGDIGGQAILVELETIAPVVAVLGNCDYDEYGPEVRDFATVRLADVGFFVMHKPKDAENALRGRGVLVTGDPLPNVCVHGHTHVPRIEKIGPTLVVCPGSPTRPRAGSEPSVMVMRLEGGAVLSTYVINVL